jgi:dTDP-4-dehydrorhamnose reductase
MALSTYIDVDSARSARFIAMAANRRLAHLVSDLDGATAVCASGGVLSAAGAAAVAEKKVVLVVGMSGLVGGLVGPALAAAGHEVRALNRRPVDGYRTFTEDIADLDAILPAFEGVDTVINMVNYVPQHPTHATSVAAAAPVTHADDVRGYIHTNVLGVYNVYEAARIAGVKRVVFTSAGAAVFNHVKDEPFAALAEGRWNDVPAGNTTLLDHTAPYRPNGVYGASKIWGEAIGRHYADDHGLSVVCVRLGHCQGDDGWDAEQDVCSLTPYQASIFISHHDTVNMYECCVGAPDSVRFETVFAHSRNKGLFRDIAHAERTLGYRPRDGMGQDEVGRWLKVRG